MGKTSINFIYPNLWAPTAGLLQGSTVMQQCAYQMIVTECLWSQEATVKPGLIWSRTVSILLSMNGEITVFA